MTAAVQFPVQLSSRILVIAALLAVSIVVALLAADLRGSTVVVSPPPPTTPEVTSLQDDVGLLRAELASLRASAGTNRPARDVRSTSAVSTAQSDTPGLTEQELQASQEERAQQRSALMETTLEAEDSDTIWSAEFEERLSTALASNDLAGSKLVATRCRSTLCRIDLQHTDQEAFERFAENAPLTAPFNTHGLMRLEDSDGELHTVTYLAREGHKLPRIPR